MLLTTVTVGPLEENCHLLLDEASGDIVAIDPGAEPARIGAAIRKTGGTLRAIWLTHAHFDHVGGIAGVRREWPDAMVHLHAADRFIYDRAAQSAAAYGIPLEAPGPPDLELAEGDILRLGTASFEVWHLPGHSPGHVAFIGEGLMLGGDVLFAGSVGRSDLPLSDPAALDRSLRRVATLPPETVVHPGHGPLTTIAAELRTNPFLNGAALIPRQR